MLLAVIVFTLLGCAMYAFKLFADGIEDDSRGMVDPNRRRPYGSWVSDVVRGKDPSDRNGPS